MKKLTAVVFAVLAAGATMVASPTVSASAATTSGNCGATVTKANGAPWTCTLDEEFNGNALDRSVWMPQTVFASGNIFGAYACYYDNPSVVNVAGGSLNLSVRRLPMPLPCAMGGIARYAAGSVTTYHLFSQQYGRFEARIKNTATFFPGLQESFWLWPDDRHSTGSWPNAGEIDVSETYSQYRNLAIPYLHYSADAQGPQPGLNTAWTCAAKRGVWNTYTLEWSASKIEIFVNGKSCLVNTSGNAAFKKPYIIQLTQLLGQGANQYRGFGPMPATTQVDYVRVWK